MYHKANRDALKGNPTATRIKNIESLNKTIKRLDTAIFMGDEPIGLRKSLYEHAEEMRISLRPEDVAERLEKGKPGVDIEPYQ